MRCVSCGGDVKKKKEKNFEGRCPRCGHAFVITDPRSVGISDYHLKRATEAVSKDGTVFYLPSHVGYEAMRRLPKPPKWPWLYRLAGLSLLALAVWIVFSSIHGFFSIVAGVAGFWLLAKSIAPTEPKICSTG